MDNKIFITAALSILLVLSVVGELIALYTGQFLNNNIPLITHIYNCILVIIILTQSSMPGSKTKEKIVYMPKNRKLFSSIEEQAEKYYIKPLRPNDYNVPNTTEINIRPSNKRAFDETCDFDENTIKSIKEQRYQSAASYLNSLQND